MNDVQPYQFEPEGALQDDDSKCIEKSAIIEESTRKQEQSVLS